MAAPWNLNFLIILGAWSAFVFVRRVVRFIYVYVRPSSIGRYRQREAWALVTGATEGIGLALVRELASRGFNVTVHGRNPQKLEAVTKELSKEFPALNFRIAVADATLIGQESKEQIERLVKDLEDVKLTVLVNNIGGPPSTMVPRYKPFDETTTSDNDDLVALNVSFPAQLTAALLPSLLKHQPSLILTLGSMAEYGNPWLSMYGGAKAFNMAWSRGLAREMKAEGRDIEVLGILTGEVTNCSHNKRPANWKMPDARTYARAVVDKVGCGEIVVNGYWTQGILKALVDRLPENIVTPMLIDVMQKQKVEYEKSR